MIIDEVCAEIRNYFTAEEDKHIGDFSIENGSFTPPFSFDVPRLIRIVGSNYNDGIHYSEDVLIDETFHGGVWIMSAPKAFMDVCKEIEAWNSKYAETLQAPYTSESFGGYSYSKKEGMESGWRAAFATRLNIWRKARL